VPAGLGELGPEQLQGLLGTAAVRLGPAAMALAGRAWAALRAPLLAAEPPTGPVGAATGVRLTAAGRRVLGGDADHVALNGIDRWIGGVHLAGADSPWRWHEGTESISRRRGG
jgi:hypothetical protein